MSSSYYLDRLDFDCLKLDDAVLDIPGLVRAIRYHSHHHRRATTIIKSVIIQLPFPLTLRTDDQRHDVLEAIGELPHLEKINMECYPISQRSLTDFDAAIQRTVRPPLKEFVAWDLQLEDQVALDSLVMTLSSLPTLEKVALGVEQHTTVATAQHQQQDHEQQQQQQQQPRTWSVLGESSLVMLCHNPRLTCLQLANLGLTLKQICFLADALAVMNTPAAALKCLELHGEQLETAGWHALAHGLERNTSLEKLCLFDFKGMNDDGAIALANALRLNRTLKSLSIENDDDTVTQLGNTAIANMLQHSSSSSNSALISFCFSSKGLNDDACMAYAQALQHNTTLRELELGTYRGGRVGSRGVTAMANMLSHNSVLEKLCMCCQQGLDDSGALAIANGLKQNNTLKHFLLEDDDDAVTYQGYQALVEMMQSNTVLETIYHENAGNLKLKMEYYLKLNQTGVRNILLNENTTREGFLDALVSHQDDLDCIHYLIMMNPSFVAHGIAPTKTQRESQHFGHRRR